MIWDNGKFSSLFLLMSNINKKIPNWIKLFFKLLFLIVLILKLLNFSIVSDILINPFNIKLLCYTFFILAFLYQLLNLYLNIYFINIEVFLF